MCEKFQVDGCRGTNKYMYIYMYIFTNRVCFMLGCRHVVIFKLGIRQIENLWNIISLLKYQFNPMDFMRKVVMFINK